ncbi:hypothetical protein SFRURICE_020772 [Spodoptera frugiperda]|nr:hypothetical protein SFRURICE_020772 [Spodoptera frugiperda]
MKLTKHLFATIINKNLQLLPRITMGCGFALIKTSIIFGAGLYTGVYVAQNYKGTLTGMCVKPEEGSDKATKSKTWAQTFVKDKLAEVGDKKDK